MTDSATATTAAPADATVIVQYKVGNSVVNTSLPMTSAQAAGLIAYLMGVGPAPGALAAPATADS